MEIIMRKVEELVPYENNPRNNEAAIEPVMNSIREFGFRIPVLIDQNDVIIAGHTRLLAAKRLEIEAIPCLYFEDMTPEQAKAFRLVDNKSSEFSTWNFDLLEKELSSLKDLDFNMGDFGFFEPDNDYIDDFFNEETAEEENVASNEETKDDAVLLIQFDLTDHPKEELVNLLNEYEYSFKILKR